jgi:CHAT domain-containing protein
MGLPFALFVAGNVNTVLTLWPVDDDVTATFMVSMFMKLRAGDTPALALNRTKREFATDPRYKKHSDPRYWAPFILIGAG